MHLCDIGGGGVLFWPIYNSLSMLISFEQWSRVDSQRGHKELCIYLVWKCLVNITGKVNGEGDDRAISILWQQVVLRFS